MRDSVRWRKQSRIIMMLADALEISAERALDLFYSTKTYQFFSDPQWERHCMSDQYIVDEVLEEIRG